MYVIILDMLQPDVEVEWFEKDHHIPGTSEDACNAYGHKAVDCNRRNMKYVRCYSCNKLGHKERECKRKFQSSKQEDHTSSQFQELKKTEKYGITQSADITDTGESESDEFQYSLHTLI